MLSRPYFIFNPAAAGGGAAGAWEGRIKQRLIAAFPDMEWTYLTPDISLAGRSFVVGVGGDGTQHDIINLIVRQGLIDEVTYAPLPLGSGNDWCRTLGIPKNIERWIEVIRRGYTIDHRIGRIDYTAEDGASATRHFINVAGMAYDAEVVRRSEKLSVKHRFLYPLLTVAYLGGFTPPVLRLDYDGKTVMGKFHTINAGIGRYNGGGMRLVPQANPTADTLALTYAVGLPLLRILTNGWRFFTPTIDRVKGVTATHATSLRVEGPCGVEADGEWLGVAPVEIGLLGGRLRVLVGELVS